MLALALYASTTDAGISARFGGAPGVVNGNTPRYDLEPLYHDGKAQRPDNRLAFGSLRLPAAPHARLAPPRART